MKNMKSILLVFDDQKELEFIQANLMENGFKTLSTDNLKDALKLAEKTIPDLIVVNTFNSESDLKTIDRAHGRYNTKYLSRENLFFIL